MALLTKIVALFCACFLAMAASAQELPEAYKVAVQIERNGNVVGAPELTVAPGVPASVTADGVYALQTTVRAEEGTFATSSSVRVSSELSFPGGGRWNLAATPSVVLTLGRRAEMTYDLPKYGRVVLKYAVEAVGRP